MKGMKNVRVAYEPINIEQESGSVEGYVVDTNQEQLGNWMKSSGFPISTTKHIQNTYIRICILKSIRVEEESRACGIGSGLLQDTINEAERKGAEAILLQADTGEQNDFNLIAWYESYGFEVTEEKNDFFPLMIYKMGER